MQFLRIYLLGVGICGLLAVLTEHFYHGKGYASAVNIKDLAEDSILIVLSWLGILGIIIFYISEAATDFSNYGCNKDLHDFAEFLKKEKEKNNQ